MKASVLVVEDQRSAGEYLLLLLRQEGYRVELVSDGIEAILALERDPYDLVMTDLEMPNMDGFELLTHVQQRWPELPVVVVTALSETAKIVEVVQAGAIDYLVKPAPPPAVIGAVRKALTLNGQLPFVERGEDGPVERAIPEIVGNSAALVEVRRQIAVATRSSVPVLITGKTGTGKELVARALHSHSPLSFGPFVPYPCSTAPPGRFEEVFFGRGGKRGLLAKADGGILFLDEIEALPLSMQAELSRVIDDGEVREVGSEGTTQVSVRFVAATSHDPRQLLAGGALREDFYFRLRGIEIGLPPLSEHLEDIPLLARHFLDRFSPGILPEAVAALVAAPWPGNVRQLRHVVEVACAAAGAARVGVQHLALEDSDESSKSAEPIAGSA